MDNHNCSFKKDTESKKESRNKELLKNEFSLQNNHNIFPKSKKSQTTILIILAIVIISLIIVYFIFREKISFGGPPKELQSVHTYYLNCIEKEVITGTAILGQQAGYIQGGEFSPGSPYMPFSSHLNFLGIGIPYWYYISGNGIVKEQIPTKEKMEDELSNFLKDRISECDFSGFRKIGFEVELGDEIGVKTKIRADSIDATVTQNLNIRTENNSWTGKIHYKKVDSDLGRLYELSKKIYEDFKQTVFLENYGVDVLRLYAPVDGVDIGCKPSIWNREEVRENLTRALEANIPQIKIRGDYYDLKNKDNKYFVHDIPAIGEADANINFLFSRNWPNKMEVWPDDQGLLIANPVGLQEGLGMLGFCYVPYHFVYDLAYPVLIQTYYKEEIFQFPVVVFINKNRPRESLNTSSLPSTVPELCLNKNTKITVSTYNNNLEPIETDIKFKCFDTTCDIGSTKLSGVNAILTANFPQCVNGYIIASKEGYETKKQLFSTVSEGSKEVFLNKEYELEIKTNTDKNSFAIITFTKDKTVKTVAYPEQKTVELSSGEYEIKAYVYSNSKINLQGSSEQKCIEIPKSGLLGAFGFTEEKCFNFEIPGQTVDTGISGGGKQKYYISETELENSKKIVIGISDLKPPTRIEELQLNYNKIETSNLAIDFE